MITPISSWRKEVFIAKRLSSTRDALGNRVYTYDEPIAYNLNVQPMTGEAIIEEFGANDKRMFRALCVNKDFDISELDKVYLEEATPIGETVNGANANFIVRRVSKQNIVTVYYFESMVKT